MVYCDLSDISSCQNIVHGHFMVGPHTDRDSCTAGAKIVYPVDIPLIGLLWRQAINLVLQAGKNLRGWSLEAKVS